MQILQFHWDCVRNTSPLVLITKVPLFATIRYLVARSFGTPANRTPVPALHRQWPPGSSSYFTGGAVIISSREPQREWVTGVGILAAGLGLLDFRSKGGGWTSHMARNSASLGHRYDVISGRTCQRCVLSERLGCDGEGSGAWRVIAWDVEEARFKKQNKMLDYQEKNPKVSVDLSCLWQCHWFSQ